uniref:Calcineurin B-like protein 4 n=1 Tax=Lygus hesperus TaxID=30085 RepID=A0A0A9W639_LYGHE
MDITRSGQINFRTWVLMLSSLSPEAHPDEKVAFAFSLYDSNDDGYIDKSDIVNLLTSSITDLSVDDVRVLINRSFELADYDKDSRINVADYKLLVKSSESFFSAFTIDITDVLMQYSVISQEEALQRIHN